MKIIKKEKTFLTHSYFKYPLPEEMLKDLALDLQDFSWLG
jgi:hypothetical protein